MTLKSLGKKTNYPITYNYKVLEFFPNKYIGNDYWIQFYCPEFSSICPITKQPDFATIYIDYIPEKKIVESKSLKLYLFGFRNYGTFHEECVNTIMKDLINLASPKYIEVDGLFAPRGGISISPYCNYGKPNTEYEQLAKTRLFTHKTQS